MQWGSYPKHSTPSLAVVQRGTGYQWHIANHVRRATHATPWTHLRNISHSRAAKLLCFEWSPPGPTVTNYFVIVSDISSGSIYGIYFLTFYSGILSGILSRQSILAFYYLASILTSYLASFLASILIFSLAFYLAFFLLFYLASILTFFLAFIPAFFLAFYVAFYLTFYSGILFWHSFWHLFWLSILPLYLAFIPAFFLAFYSILTSSLTWALPTGAGASGSPLRPGPRRWGPAVPTEICSSPLRSGSAHWDLHLVVEVRRPLRSGVRSWGQAVPTEISEIWSLPLGKGGRKEGRRREGTRKRTVETLTWQVGKHARIMQPRFGLFWFTMFFLFTFPPFTRDTRSFNSLIYLFPYSCNILAWHFASCEKFPTACTRARCSDYSRCLPVQHQTSLLER